VQLRDAIEILAGGVFDAGPTVWADLGCGTGTFTVALASRLAPGSTIHAIDRDATALRQLPTEHHGVTIVSRAGDMTDVAWLADLDGVLMANSLHYVRDQAGFIDAWKSRLAPGGRFLIIEYDTDAANRWVPFPVSRRHLSTLIAQTGQAHIQDLGRRASTYRRAPLYAALVTAGADNDGTFPWKQ
jgi:trans-aconitate methyltransferase